MENDIYYPPTPPAYDESNEFLNPHGHANPGTPPTPPTPRRYNNTKRDRVIHPDDLFWRIMKVKIERVIEHMLKTIVEIRIEPKSINRSRELQSQGSYVLRICEDSTDLFTVNHLDPYEKNISLEEQVSRLFDRSDLLQDKYRILLERVSTKVEALRTVYNEEEYDVLVSKIPGSGLEYLERYNEEENLIEPYDENVSTDEENVSMDGENMNENILDNSVDEELSYLYPETYMEEITHDYPMALDEHSGLLIIGPNGTTIRREFYEDLQQKSPTAATRLLCDLIFGDDILATHSLTGNQSPAFLGRQMPVKKQLDPLKTEDITQLVCSKFNVNQQLVRSTITTKCADAAKKVKRILSKIM